MKKYPDMTKLFALRKARRERLLNMPVEEKMEIARRLQEMGRLAPGCKKNTQEADEQVVPRERKVG